MCTVEIAYIARGHATVRRIFNFCSYGAWLRANWCHNSGRLLNFAVTVALVWRESNCMCAPRSLMAVTRVPLASLIWRLPSAVHAHWYVLRASSWMSSSEQNPVRDSIAADVWPTSCDCNSKLSTYVVKVTSGCFCCMKACRSVLIRTMATTDIPHPSTNPVVEPTEADGEFLTTKWRWRWMVEAAHDRMILGWMPIQAATSLLAANGWTLW